MAHTELASSMVSPIRMHSYGQGRNCKPPFLIVDDHYRNPIVSSFGLDESWKIFHPIELTNMHLATWANYGC